MKNEYLEAIAVDFAWNGKPIPLECDCCGKPQAVCVAFDAHDQYRKNICEQCLLKAIEFLKKVPLG